MIISNLIKNIQIPMDDYVLIEYDFYFNEDLGKYNKFSIDDENDIEKLKLVINEIKKLDDAIDIYVLGYSYETIDYQGLKSMYADCLWLNTTISIDGIHKIFEGHKSIQPSSIDGLKEMDEYNQEHFYLIKNNGDVIDLKEICSMQKFDNVKILYWN